MSKYKLDQQGKQYIVVDRLALTAKTCHECGHVNEKLTVRDKNWICPLCGAFPGTRQMRIKTADLVSEYARSR